MAKPQITAAKGVYDVYERDASRRWEKLDTAFFELAQRYGYPRLTFPIFEHTELFVRSVGEATDIVHKEMYTFADRSDRSLTLRPEGTAGVVRAFVEHHLDQGGLPWKAAYFGPMFRAERPQRGRYRQFFQFGVEAIGVDDPDLDVEVIELAWHFFASIGLADVTLKLNTLGELSERRTYIDELRRYITDAVPDLGEDDRRRLELNPLRLLDSKDAEMIEVLAQAPTLLDFLGDPTRERFTAVRAGLETAGIPYVVDAKLVRGLDYYTATTFEFASAALEAAQDAIGGGGHYDGLVELIGGPPLPGIGFGLGVDRILLAADAEHAVRVSNDAVDVVVTAASSQSEIGDIATRIVRELRAEGIRTDTPYGSRSLKAQLKHADRLGAAYVVVVGGRDLADGVVTLRDMNSGSEQRVPRDAIAREVARKVHEVDAK